MPTASDGWPARRRANARAGPGTLWLLALPWMFVVLALLAPLGAVLWTAISEKGLSDGATVLSDHLVTSAAQRTVIMAALVTLIAWVLGTLYAFGLAFAGPRLRAYLFAALLAIFWVSIVVRMYGWILLYQPSGMLSDVLRGLHLIGEPLDIYPSTFAMYPAMVHVMLPFMIFPLYAALVGIDPSQVRAAESLGARPMTVIFKVLLPQMKGGSAAGCVLVFLMTLGFYVTPAMLGSESDLTIGTIIDLQFNQLLDFGAAAVMASAILAVVLALYTIADSLISVSSRWSAGDL